MARGADVKRCTRCGRDQPIEEFAIRKGKKSRQSWCRTCKNAYDRDWYRRNKQSHIQAVNEAKRHRTERNRALIRDAKSVPCADCGVSYPSYVMDFDHGDADKEAHVGQAIWSWSRQRLLSEINKCDVVCANCHRERTYNPHNGRLPCHCISS